MNVEKQRKFDEMYMKMAILVSEMSYCNKRKVGSIIIKGDAPISIGYNGTPSGFENVCEFSSSKSGKQETLPYVIHAEANAITKIACNTLSSEGSTLYVTCSPCMECSKLIIQAKIKRLVYINEHDVDGLEILKRAGVEIIKLY